MFFAFSIFTVNCYLTVLLSSVCILGDYLIFYAERSDGLRAIVDNLTHGFVGGICWSIVIINCKDLSSSSLHSLVQILYCFIIASVIDLDHFFVAKSFSLKDATNLKRRPPLHCTTIPLTVVPLLLVISWIAGINIVRRTALILFTAFISHHIRDATRRGFWLYPFGSTPPIPYFSYLMMTCVLPYIVCIFHKLLPFHGEMRSLDRILSV